MPKFMGIPAADSYAAIAVSLFVGIQSIRQAKDAVDVLMDHIPNSKHATVLVQRLHL